MDIYEITASALTAQRLRLDTIASNLANVNTTRQADGTPGAYHRRNVVFAPLMAQANENAGPAPGGQIGQETSGGSGMGVQVLSIKEDHETPMRMVYSPGHPDANKDGFVEMPNINMVTEMVDMIAASRAYEANVTAFQSAKQMSQAALEM